MMGDNTNLRLPCLLLLPWSDIDAINDRTFCTLLVFYLKNPFYPHSIARPRASVMIYNNSHSLCGSHWRSSYVRFTCDDCFVIDLDPNRRASMTSIVVQPSRKCFKLGSYEVKRLQLHAHIITWNWIHQRCRIDTNPLRNCTSLISRVQVFLFLLKWVLISTSVISQVPRLLS